MRISGQIESICVVNDAVKDGVCMGGVGEARKPVSHRDLGSDQGGDTPKAVIKDFKQVAGFGSRIGIAHPIIKDEKIDFGQTGEQNGERAVQVRLGQLEQEAGSAEVAHRMVGAAGRQSQHATEE